MNEQGEKMLRANRRLEKQCCENGIHLMMFHSAHTEQNRSPEEIALDGYLAQGYKGTWCEGGSLNLLMKAACLSLLIRYNSFRDPEDAKQRFFEAHCTILAARAEELIQRMLTANREEVEVAIRQILSNPFVKGYYPRVTEALVMMLWDALQPEQLRNIAEIFMRAPYDYRAGWPDLTLIGDDSLYFVEVKTTDSLHMSQLRILNDFAKPLGLNFSVLRVV